MMSQPKGSGSRFKQKDLSHIFYLLIFIFFGPVSYSESLSFFVISYISSVFYTDYSNFFKDYSMANFSDFLGNSAHIMISIKIAFTLVIIKRTSSNIDHNINSWQKKSWFLINNQKIELQFNWSKYLSNIQSSYLREIIYEDHIQT